MINELIDVSISTMIGNLPDIINRNNDAIEGEFAKVFTYDTNGNNPKLTVDVDAHTVSAQTGSFRNLQFSGQVLNASFVEKYNKVDASLVDMSDRITRIEDELHLTSSVYGAATVPVQTVFGSAIATQSADLSDFFSTTVKGRIDGLTADSLQTTALYRQLDNIRIPLSVGTILTNNGLSLMVYHDHITKTAVQRLYVPVATGEDGESLVQIAPASTINLKS